MTNKTLLIALLALASAAPGYAQSKVKIKTKPGKTTAAPAAAVVPAPAPTDWSVKYADLVTAERLRTHLAVLASDEYEGRETGTKGQHMAAAYVAEQFKNAGLTGPIANPADPYQQHFNVEQVTWADGASLKVGKKSYQWLVDFYGMGDSPFATETTVKPVFLGYGIEQPGYSDYAGQDVTGKDVLILLGEPTSADGKALLSPDGSPTKWGNDYRAKAQLAAQKGARTAFFVSFNPTSNFAKQTARLAPMIAHPSTVMVSDAKPNRVPSFFISPAVGLQVLGTKDAAMQAYLAKINSTKQPVKSTFKVVPMQVKAERKRTPVQTENVLGFIEGTDKKEDIIVVSAHHDHLGIQNGVVFNGADDDGSGTSGIITIAEAFAKAKAEGHGPRRSLLFLSVTGEEKGLFGSEYYSKHPVFPLAQTEADLNVDMIGRTDVEHEGKPDYVYVIGSDKLASELKVIQEEQNKKYTQLDLDYRFDDPADPNRFYYRSDHYNFAVNKVPVAFFFNGVHADYHKESDEISKIEFPKMEKRAKLVFHLAWELANRDGRIVVDSNKL
ncbi:M28 family peptidase [Hymenobacter sp. BT770]|uniref:M28 family peptidase n=1 Tax=Hymenobacter sp. BT770 TaxID=2886942 RepID=UPI001D1276CE|nr:M28 family peptidase [Hymenobacter sp. BT770]MCC3153687.1 M28 family peptidase [Hymenobacter sp. BT770]MDO3415847.1 M28 family peptidase [Hymenobacter sp. BT770]